MGRNVLIILDKEYYWESLPDIEEDIFDAINRLDTDEYDDEKYLLKVTVEYEKDEE